MNLLIRVIISLFSIILFVFTLNGQTIHLNNYFEKHSSFILDDKFHPIHWNIIDSISKEYQAYRQKNLFGDSYYIFWMGMINIKFWILDAKIILSSPQNLRINNIEKSFQIGDSIHLVGFSVLSSAGKKQSKKFSQLLLSAYLQETDSSYLCNLDNFIVLPEKSNAEFWKRNLINMGYGLSYVADKNPYASENIKLFGYVWEGLHYIPILGGAFIGRTKNDKIAIPIIGLSSLLIWKTLYFGVIIGQPMIKEYNRKLKMKYKIPKAVLN